MIESIKRSGVLYVVPAVIVVSIVMLYPLIYTLSMGFFEYTLMMESPVFTGFNQYIKLFNNKIFLSSIRNTLVWTFGSVFFQFAIGFILAMVIHQSFVKFKTSFRILLMVPWVMPSIISSAVWKWMYNADYGIINYVLSSFGLVSPGRTWLSNPNYAMWAVIAVNVWKMFPFILLMIEAALQGVPESLKEAARIDGANQITVFRHITWPSIRATCYSTILLMTIWTLNAFTFIYALTEGGPAHKTEVLSMFIYKRAFTDYNFGIASAASTILFCFSMGISVIYLYLTKEKGESR